MFQREAGERLQRVHARVRQRAIELVNTESQDRSARWLPTSSTPELDRRAAAVALLYLSVGQHFDKAENRAFFREDPLGAILGLMSIKGIVARIAKSFIPEAARDYLSWLSDPNSAFEGIITQLTLRGENAVLESLNQGLGMARAGVPESAKGRLMTGYEEIISAVVPGNQGTLKRDLANFFAEELNALFGEIPTSFDRVFSAADGQVLYLVSGQRLYRLVNLSRGRTLDEVNAEDAFFSAHHADLQFVAGHLPMPIQYEHQGATFGITHEIYEASADVIAALPPSLSAPEAPAPEAAPQPAAEATEQKPVVQRGKIARWIITQLTLPQLVRWGLSLTMVLATFYAVGHALPWIGQLGAAVPLLAGISHVAFAPFLFSVLAAALFVHVGYAIVSAFLSWIPGFGVFPAFLDRYPLLRKVVKLGAIAVIVIYAAPAIAGATWLTAGTSALLALWSGTAAYSFLGTPSAQLNRPAVRKATGMVLISGLAAGGVYVGVSMLALSVLALPLAAVTFFVTSLLLGYRWYGKVAAGVAVRSGLALASALLISVGVYHAVLLSAVTLGLGSAAVAVAVGLSTAFFFITWSIFHNLFRSKQGPKGGMISLIAALTAGVVTVTGLLAAGVALPGILTIATFVLTLGGFFWATDFRQRLTSYSTIHRQILGMKPGQESELVQILYAHRWSYRDAAQALRDNGYLDQPTYLQVTSTEPGDEIYRDSFRRVTKSIYSQYAHLQNFQIPEDLLDQLPTNTDGSRLSIPKDVPYTVFKAPNGELWVVLGAEAGLETQGDSLKSMLQWASDHGIPVSSSEGMNRQIRAKGTPILPRTMEDGVTDLEIPNLRGLQQYHRGHPKNFTDSNMRSAWYRKYEIMLSYLFNLLSTVYTKFPWVGRRLDALANTFLTGSLAHYVRPFIADWDALFLFAAARNRELGAGALGVSEPFWLKRNRAAYVTGQAQPMSIDDVDDFIGAEFVEMVTRMRSVKAGHNINMAVVRVRELAAIHELGTRNNQLLTDALLTQGTSFEPTQEMADRMASRPKAAVIADLHKIERGIETAGKLADVVMTAMGKLPFVKDLDLRKMAAEVTSQVADTLIPEGEWGDHAKALTSKVGNVLEWAFTHAKEQIPSTLRKWKVLLYVALIETYAEDDSRFGKQNAGRKIAELIDGKMEIESVLTNFVASGLLSDEEAEMFRQDKKGQEEWFWIVKTLKARHFGKLNLSRDVVTTAEGLTEYRAKNLVRTSHLYAVPWWMPGAGEKVNQAARRLRLDLKGRLRITDGAVITDGDLRDSDRISVSTAKGLPTETLRALFRGEAISYGDKKYFTNYLLEIVDGNGDKQKSEILDRLSSSDMGDLLDGKTINIDGKPLHLELGLSMYLEELSEDRVNSLGLDKRVVKFSKNLRDIERFVRKERLSISISGKETLSGAALESWITERSAGELREFLDRGRIEIAGQTYRSNFVPRVINEQWVQAESVDVLAGRNPFGCHGDRPDDGG